jgi:hypothetical protein
MIGPDLEGPDLEDRVAGVVRRYMHGGRWKITQYIYQQMPEQSGGGCSGI